MKRSPPPTQPAVVRYLTPAGHRKLADELEFLHRKERPRVVQEVADAAAQGDRSENAEYIYGKKRLREIDGRIRFLTQRLDGVQIVDPAAQRGDRVVFGATVGLEDEDGRAVTYTIVGEDETEPSEGRISWRSPLGRVLIGRRVGDVVNVQRPGGTSVEYSILALRFG